MGDVVDLPDRLKDQPLSLRSNDDVMIVHDQAALNGAIAGALAKAQAAFPDIQRKKEVTVTSQRTGRSYKFKYAPLDQILTAVRKPLADNGLAITQLFDGDVLVTMLAHESGGVLMGRMTIPHKDGDGVQELGSAITYLRRYSIQAILGIAAEEDDDGNRASGNTADFGSAPASDPLRDGLIGTARKEKRATTDFELRQSPEGAFIGFRLKDGDGTGVICEVRGPMAEALKALEASVIDAHVQVWGEWVSYEPPTVKYGYKALRVARLRTPDFTLPAPDGTGQAVAASDPSAASGDHDGGLATDRAAPPSEPEPETPSGSTAPEKETVRSSAPLPVAAETVAGATGAAPAAALCGKPGPYSEGETCDLVKGHRGPHKNFEDNATWL